MRATSLEAFAETPALRERIRNGIRVRGKLRAAAA
jgi:hypothetical protein